MTDNNKPGDVGRLYSLAKANNALARMNAKRAEKAEKALAEKEGRMEWLLHMHDEAIAKRDTMYLARQESERALDRVKAALKRRSEPVMDPPYTAAFNAALDMVSAALTQQESRNAE